MSPKPFLLQEVLYFAFDEFSDNCHRAWGEPIQVLLFSYSCPCGHLWTSSLTISFSIMCFSVWQVVGAVTYQILPPDTQFAEIPLAAVKKSHQRQVTIWQFLCSFTMSSLCIITVCEVLFCWSAGYWECDYVLQFWQYPDDLNFVMICNPCTAFIHLGNLFCSWNLVWCISFGAGFRRSAI